MPVAVSVCDALCVAAEVADTEAVGAAETDAVGVTVSVPVGVEAPVDVSVAVAGDDAEPLRVAPPLMDPKALPVAVLVSLSEATLERDPQALPVAVPVWLAEPVSVKDCGGEREGAALPEGRWEALPTGDGEDVAQPVCVWLGEPVDDALPVGEGDSDAAADADAVDVFVGQREIRRVFVANAVKLAKEAEGQALAKGEAVEVGSNVEVGDAVRVGGSVDDGRGDEETEVEDEYVQPTPAQKPTISRVTTSLPTPTKKKKVSTV